MYMVTKGSAKRFDRTDGKKLMFERGDEFRVNEDFGMNELLGLTNPAEGREYTVDAGPHGCKLMYLTQGKLLELCARFPALKAVLTLYCDEKLAQVKEEHDLQRTRSLTRDSSVNISDVHQHLKDQHHLVWLNKEPMISVISDMRQELGQRMASLEAKLEKMATLEAKLDRLLAK
jgi:hypothetical protein